MSISVCDSLKKTAPLPLHRIFVAVYTKKQWYAIMAECRECFGKNWKTQSRIRRKIESYKVSKPLQVWFDVPEASFGSWLAVKHSLEVSIATD